MKKTILLLLTLTISQFATGQINKGAILIEGTVSFNKSETENEFSVNSSFVTDELKSTFFAFRPRIGFFTSKTFLIGMGLNYEHNGYEYKTSYDGTQGTTYSEKSNIYLINPYIRKFIQLKENIFFTISGNAFVGLGKVKYGENSEIKSNILDLRINVAPGFTYFVSRQWAVTANLGQLFYSYKREKLATDIGLSEQPKNIDKDYGVSFQFNTFGVGVQYFLRNKE